MLFERAAAVEIHPPIVAFPFRVEGLRVEFTVKKNLKKSSNTAVIMIYNMAEKSRSNIRELDDRVVLMAGYRQSAGMAVVFEGTVVSVDHTFQPPDIVTRIEANDGEKALRKSTVQVSYAENVSATRIMDDMIKAMGLPKKFVAKLKDSKYLQGFAHVGAAKDALAKVVERLGAEYSIQNEQIQVLEKGKGNQDSQTAIFLTPDSGLIGSPERQRQILEEGQAEKKPPGWRLRSLLEPRLLPGGWVAVQSREIRKATAFRVEAVEHRGDTDPRGAWESITEVTDTTAVPV